MELKRFIEDTVENTISSKENDKWHWYKIAMSNFIRMNEEYDIEMCKEYEYFFIHAIAMMSQFDIKDKYCKNTKTLEPFTNLKKMARATLNSEDDMGYEIMYNYMLHDFRRRNSESFDEILTKAYSKMVSQDFILGI